MNDSFAREFNHAMDSLCFSDTAKENMVDRLMAQPHPTDKPRSHSRKLALVLLAAALALVTFTGAAVYTRWTRSMEGKYQPTQQIKEQAEKSGLATMLETTEAADVFSATDQGITITAVQSVMDKYGAQLVFRVEGLNLPDGGKPTIQLENREMIQELHAVTMPVKFYENETNGYTLEDGSLEFTLHLLIPNTNEITSTNKAVHIQITAIGTTDTPSMIQGNWDLHWNLTGTADSNYAQLRQRIDGTGFTLLEADITPITMSVLFMVDNSEGTLQVLEHGFDPDTKAASELLRQMLVGYRTKDGIVHTNIDGATGHYSTLTLEGVAIKYPDYQEEAKDHILMGMDRPLTSIIEPEDVDTIVLLKPESVDKPQEEWTTEDYIFVPLS